MPPTARCRSATLADLAALHALELQFPGDRLSKRQLRYHLQRPGRALRVLVAGRHIVGYALTLLRVDSRNARLYSLVVGEQQRGRGYGQVLLADAEQQARRRGAQALRLEVRVDNAVAQTFYRAAGYAGIGRRPHYYEDGVDALRLARLLADVAPE